MSYTYLQEQGEESSAASFSDIPQSVLSRLNLTAEKSYFKDNETASCQSSQSGTMSPPSTELRGGEKSMSSAEDFPAKTLALPGKVTDSTVNEVDCGEKWPESFATWHPDSFSWKIRQLWLFEDLDESLAIWPRWGIMHDGECWEPAMLALRTRGSASGSWPTPQRVDYKGATSGSTFEQRRQQWILWSEGAHESGTIYPNPTAYEAIMGWPLGWTDLKPLETARFQQWLRSHGESLAPKNELNTQRP